MDDAEWERDGDEVCRPSPIAVLDIATTERERDAAFIAAANPTAVLALLEERDALRAAVERVRALADEFDEGHWRGAARELRAALDGPA